MIEMYDLEPGPMLVVSLQMEGEFSSSDITGEVKDRFLSSFAQAMGLKKERVFIVAMTGARRRLLAVTVEIGVATKSQEDASAVQTSVESADLSEVAADAGLPDAKVAGVETKILQPGDESESTVDSASSPSEVGAYVAVVITLVVVICGMAGCYWFWHHPSMSKSKDVKDDDASKTSSADADLGFVEDSVQRQTSIAMLAEDIERECLREDVQQHPFSDQLGHLSAHILSDKMKRAIGWWKYRSERIGIDYIRFL